MNYGLMSRDTILKEAVELVGYAGEVRDYQCDCHPGGELFIVKWNDDWNPICYNLDQLRDEIKSLENVNVTLES